MKGLGLFTFFLLGITLLVMSCRQQRTDIQNKGEMKIAICQIFCLDGDRGGNLVRIENALHEARDMGADIACFPETSIYGWVNPDARQWADSIPGRDSDTLCRLAEKYGMYMAIGLAEKDGENLYDSAILIDDQGEILLKHRKFNILTELMDPPYTPGNGEISCIDTRFGRIGMMICADSFNEEYVEKMAAVKPGLLIIPYGWAAEIDAWPEHGQELNKVVTRTAKTTGVVVVGTDLVGEISHGPWTGQVYGGQSLAVEGNGNVLVSAKDRDRDIQLITLSR